MIASEVSFSKIRHVVWSFKFVFMKTFGGGQSKKFYSLGISNVLFKVS